MTLFSKSGPLMRYEYGEVECCRIWPVVTASFTWSQKDEMWKKESWWWRKCGLCDEVPRLIG